MGIIKRGILGGFSGKVGNLVGSSWKGIAVIKSMPLSVANPRTAAQVAQRTSFSLSVVLAAAILADWVKPFWDRWAVQMSGFNAFVQKNVSLVSTSPTAPYSNVVMASGKLGLTPLTFGPFAAGQSDFPVHWTDDSGVGMRQSSDLVHVIAFGNDLSKIVKSDGLFRRNEELAIAEMPVGVLVEGDVWNIACVFVREDGTIVSDSFIETITVTA